MSSTKPQIEHVAPAAAIPGGEFEIRGRSLASGMPPRVTFGDTVAPVLVGSEELIIARVPENVTGADMVIAAGDQRSPAWTCEIGVQIADSVHPVANPVVDAQGHVFTTLSGSRGQKTPVSVYRLDPDFRLRPFLSDVLNATGLAFDRDGLLYISSRHEGVVYQSTPKGEMAVYVEGMGTATGLAFDAEGNLYVGDRSGTIFKISPDRKVYVFATVEPSISAYHLAFGPGGDLYLTGPTTSSFDAVYRINPQGEVSTFYRGLGRPQGLAFDQEGRLYVAASLGGRRGIVRFQNGLPEQFVSGPGIVGLAFAPGGRMVVATTNALYRLQVRIAGRRLPE